MNKEDYIQKYFKQSLSKDETKEFKILLDNDSEFKALFEEQLDLRSAFKYHEATVLKNYLKSIDNSYKTKTIPWYRTSIFYYAAAAILIIGLCVPFLLGPSSDVQFEDYFEVYPNVEQPIVRGTEETEISVAFKAYEANKFPIAIDAFRNLLEEGDNPNYRFYYAMSFLNNNQTDLALKELSKIESINFDYQNEVLWYTALIHIKNKETSEALTKIKELENLGSSFKSKERKLLLQKLQ